MCLGIMLSCRFVCKDVVKGGGMGCFNGQVCQIQYDKCVNSVCTISNNFYVTNNHYHILKIDDEVIRTNIRQTWQLPIHINSLFLRETNVPGAKLLYKSKENHSNIQLQRWQECQSLAKTGNQSQLIQNFDTFSYKQKQKVMQSEKLRFRY